MSSKVENIRYAGTFVQQRPEHKSTFSIKLTDLHIGYNYVDQYIIHVNQQKEVEWVISNLCDHANGTLQPCDDNSKAVCPLHGWELDLTTLSYQNVNVKKNTIEFTLDEGKIYIEQATPYLVLPKQLQTTPTSLNIRFLAHACLYLETENVQIITDPWLEGPCFMNGWWHQPRPPADAIEKLLTADVIYISHNHPDHMHMETLRIIQDNNPDVNIIIPNFKSKSTERPLKNMGFSNIHTLAFNQIYKLEPSDAYVAIFKSGDFRDDSGLYLYAGGKQVLLTVDSSNLNQLILPKEIDFLATSFSGGASGHPWCFEHYTETQKEVITKNRHISVKKSVYDYIKACQPKSYMPYAGYFTEAAPRDEYIRKHNRKISTEIIASDIKQSDLSTLFIDPHINDQVNISAEIQLSNNSSNRKNSYTSKELRNYLEKEHYPNKYEFLEACSEYFLNSNYHDSLLLYLIPCADDFTPQHSGIMIDFSKHPSNQSTFDSPDDFNKHYNDEPSKQRKLLIKARSPQLWDVITNKKSWEELAIGFHCRIHRKPDVYNSDFWYHFSNIYVQ